MSDTLHRITVEIGKASAERANACMVRPKREPFDHGEQVGYWQGLQAALAIIEAIVEEEQQKGG